MSGHISPVKTYLAIFGTLMVLTIITVAVAFNGLLARLRYPAYFARAQLAPSPTSQRANAASPAT